MSQLDVLASTSAGLSALIGVVIGGAITLGGQVLIERQHRKRADADRKRAAMGVARLAWNEFWYAQGILHKALKTERWWPMNHQPQTELSNDDRRLLAEGVEWRQWSDVTRVWRRLARLRLDLEEIDGGGRDLRLMAEERDLVKDAAQACDRAFVALEPLAGSPKSQFIDATKDLRIRGRFVDVDEAQPTDETQP
jgi:hypothetical protein